jgi:cephalosporin hydroxylase
MNEINVPEPLDCLVPAFGATDWQMSFAERICLEGLLSQIKPALSIEIGVAQGGSLGTLSYHSREVHAFDVVMPDIRPPKVRFHQGDSKETLPKYMESDDTPIDFALVDGDHSALGVCDDLANLMVSPRCKDTVIVAHDSANAEVREGIKTAVHICTREYVDLDFLPGYTFARGAFEGQTWGGFALIVMGSPPDAKPLYRA